MSLNVSFFTGYGKIGDYAKTQTMKQKWKNRKATNDFSSKEDKTVKYDTRSTSDIVRDKIQDEANKIKESYDELLKKDDDSGSRMTEIRNKYMAGGKLSADEMEYVSKKDPKFYQEIKAEERELKSFEKELRSAKTKEEAQRVIQEEANSALSRVNSVINNPHISEGDKMAVCVAEYRKLVKKQEIFAKFAEKGEYNKLPTEAEKQKAEEEIREAREEELRQAGRKENDIEGEEKSSGNRIEPSTSEREDISSKETAGDNSGQGNDEGKAETLAGKDVFKKPFYETSRRSGDAGISGEKTVSADGTKKVYKSSVQAENTPEALKVKRSRHNSGRSRLYHQDEESSGVGSHVWNA
ncbi:hypothetical protein [Oribacterium sp. P6A1]|uniref:hypothetical protein n=1 Tax=Oribacterium sp. P6A1 TaxID=1410612 RepID=UPI0005627AB0|nr:hypothetical protein [Oribacterium sp. P6A1]